MGESYVPDPDTRVVSYHGVPVKLIGCATLVKVV